MKAKVVILGVNHGYQLVSKECQPAAYRAFFDRVKPDGIGIERAPEQFTRGSYYEFTYEQQSLCAPYAMEHGIQLHPFDWMNDSEDQSLVWGVTDIEKPPVVRKPNLYNDFTHFPKLEETFFYSEHEEVIARINEWLDNKRQGQADFPRRLFLYRTFMQAMRIKQIAKQYIGKTLLIVVGHMHKSDLEEILRGEEYIDLIQPSTFGYPEDKEIVQHLKVEDLFAIASFNLLGMQQYYEVDRTWVKEVIELLESIQPGAETAVFKVLLNKEEKQGEDLIETYRTIHDELYDNRQFTYTGLVDETRIDSYFFPFAKLTMKSYLKFLMAKEYLKLQQPEKALLLKECLIDSEAFSDLQKFQFEGYWERFIVK